MSTLRLGLVFGLALASTACGSLLGLDDDASDDDTGNTKNGSGGASSSGSGTSGGGTSSGGGSHPGGSSGAQTPDAEKGTPQHVFTGEFNGCILSDTGVLACWGSNQSGQLAQGGPQSGASSNVPLRVRGAAGSIGAVSVGRSALCLVADGSIACAGSNQFGELGDGSAGRSELGVLASLTDVRDVAAGANTTCAVTNDGAVSCWGANGGLQAGKDDPQKNVSTPNPVAGTLTVERVAVGDAYACAAATDAIECWGNNTSNRLGQAGATQTRVPVAVQAVNGTITSLSLGSSHACAIVDGGARCWGSNLFGELGVPGISGQSEGAVTPTGLDSGVTSLGAGFGITCAVQDEALFCWGQNSQGQLGIGSTEAFTLPQPVDVGGPVAEVSCGYMHVCAIRTDGEAFCWGGNTQGELGAGIVAASANTPQPVRWDLL